MNSYPVDPPERLASLTTGHATSFLTEGVRAGQDEIPQVAVVRAATPLDGYAVRWSTAPVREILDEAMDRFADARTDADAWLAPRLHATVRMSRAEAADPGLWNFLALAVAPDYVLWRHVPVGQSEEAEPKKVNAARFVGPHYSQAFARLWWSAEMFRDGPDYGPAVVACGNQDMINTALRLDAVDHKPTALAMARVLQQWTESGANRLGDRVNALCTAVNTAGSTLMYEVIAPDDAPDHAARAAWIDEAETAPSVPWERLPDGPDDGSARRTSCSALTRMFEQFAAEAPLRDRARAGATAD
ncbi:DUF6339 family protein [Streptomyces albidoflavus]